MWGLRIHAGERRFSHNLKLLQKENLLCMNHPPDRPFQQTKRNTYRTHWPERSCIHCQCCYNKTIMRFLTIGYSSRNRLMKGVSLHKFVKDRKTKTKTMVATVRKGHTLSQHGIHQESNCRWHCWCSICLCLVFSIWNSHHMDSDWNSSPFCPIVLLFLLELPLLQSTIPKGSSLREAFNL